MSFSSIRPFNRFAAPSCALIAVSMLGACAGAERPAMREPLGLTLVVKAHSNVNPDDHKVASPIAVRVYELKNADSFNQADFYSLYDKDKTVLAEDLLVRDQLLLRPGEDKTIVRDANDASTALGVIAAFRDLPNAVWRATWPLPATAKAAWYRRAPKLKLSIDLSEDAIKITDTQSQNN